MPGRGSIALLGGLMAVAASATAGEWRPQDWAGASTVQLRTTAPGETAHWFPVWLVVIDGQLYVRLGKRAASRIVHNATAPYVGVRIGGQEFSRVTAQPAPEVAGRVAEAMAAKYWSDVLVRHFSHPLTVRLVLEPAAAPAG
jgi:hypothetical protein